MKRDDPNYMKEYRRKNPEKHRGQNKRHYRENKASYKARSKKWRETNRARSRELASNHRSKDPTKYRERSLRWYHQNKAKARAAKIKRVYGLTVEEHDALMQAQGGACAICREMPTPKNPLRVDHCHRSTKVRGLLCNKCNAGLGMFGDNREMLERAIAYLINSSSGVTSTMSSAL